MNSRLARQGNLGNNFKEMFDLNSFNYSFNSTQTLLSNFSPNTFPETFKNSKRNLAHHSARVALMQCLGIKDYNYERFEIVNHTYLKNWPDLKVSLSHTDNHAMACINDKVKSLGVDFEDKKRALTDQMYKYFLNPNDQKNIEPLKLWVIKEASFKAISPFVSAQEKLVLGKISIKDGTFNYKNFKGNFLVSETSIDDSEFFFAIAYLENV
jgi:4'-phosphopantetheinyl transferase EntD